MRAAASLATIAAVAIAALAHVPAAATARERDPGAHRVLALRLEGVVSPVMDDRLRQAIARAEQERFDALLVELDTPGGLETSMRGMVQRLLACRRPVIVWVSPAGAHAASAGVFLTMAADVAAMAPGTNIGAATPISMSGAMDSTLARKATNDAAAFARSVAAQRGRNVAWAERAVREAVAVHEREAAEQGIVDFVAATQDEVLALADGRAWRRADGAQTPIATRGARVERMQPTLTQRLLGVLVDPNVAYLLLMLGFYGLLFEMQNPGAILPGVVGGISLVLALLSLSVLPVNGAGVALLVLGMGFLLAEIKVHSHGMLTLGGALALALGGLILFEGSPLHVSLALVAAVTTVTLLFFVFVIGAGVRARRRPVVNGSAGLLGVRAVVCEALAPAGRVRIGAEVWNATASVVVATGVVVEVTGVDGLTLRVRPAIREG